MLVQRLSTCRQSCPAKLLVVVHLTACCLKVPRSRHVAAVGWDMGSSHAGIQVCRMTHDKEVHSSGCCNRLYASVATAACSPPISSSTSRHKGLGNCRHCFSTMGREAAAVYLKAGVPKVSVLHTATGSPRMHPAITAMLSSLQHQMPGYTASTSDQHGKLHCLLTRLPC